MQRDRATNATGQPPPECPPREAAEVGRCTLNTSAWTPALKALVFQLIESAVLSSRWFQHINLLHPYTEVAEAPAALPALSPAAAEGCPPAPPCPAPPAETSSSPPAECSPPAEQAHEAAAPPAAECQCAACPPAGSDAAAPLGAAPADDDDGDNAGDAIAKIMKKATAQAARDVGVSLHPGGVSTTGRPWGEEHAVPESVRSFSRRAPDTPKFREWRKQEYLRRGQQWRSNFLSFVSPAACVEALNPTSEGSRGRRGWTKKKGISPPPYCP